jgi:hypothetical protein
MSRKGSHGITKTTCGPGWSARRRPFSRSLSRRLTANSNALEFQEIQIMGQFSSFKAWLTTLKKRRPFWPAARVDLRSKQPSSPDATRHSDPKPWPERCNPVRRSRTAERSPSWPMPAKDRTARPRRNVQEQVIPERWFEVLARIAKRLFAIVLFWLLLLSAIAGVVIVSDWFSPTDPTLPLEHKVCPQCQALLKAHGIKLVNPELAGCHGSIHAAEYLKNKRAK